MKTMIYPRAKKPIKNRKLLRRLLGALLGLLVLFTIGGWWGGNFGLAATLARPFWYLGNRVGAGAGGVLGLIKNKEKILADNEALRLRLEEAELALIKQDQLLAENEELRRSLGLPQPISQKLVAEVLAGPDRSYFDTFLIDTGSDFNQADTLAVGDLVGLKGGLALGRIIEIGTKVSKVKLFSAPGSELLANLGEAATPVKLIGRGLGNFIAEVPRGVGVKVGDQAVFHNYGTDWQVATVGTVEKTDSETLQTVLLRTAVNLNQLRYVEVYHY